MGRDVNTILFFLTIFAPKHLGPKKKMNIPVHLPIISNLLIYLHQIMIGQGG